jgi:hypothetical protein
MPFFLWTVRSRADRAQQMHCAAAYEAILAQRYPVWLNRQDAPLLLRQFTLLRDLLDAAPQRVVVWLVADGMTWWQGGMLRELCREHGLFAQRLEPGVALLPSLTSIAKRGLVTGVAQVDAPQGSIAQTAREQLERIGVTHWVGYEPQALLEVLRNAEPPRCALWFVNTLDQLAHERAQVADDGLVRGFLEQTARSLAAMRDLCTERGYGFQVLVGSDHGSTLLPGDAPTRRLPHATRAVIDVWETPDVARVGSPVAARAALVTEGQALDAAQLADWHLLERQTFQLHQSYLVPKGYAAVGRRPAGWTHGGLTPEETIVPLLHLAPEPLRLEPLQLSLDGQVRSLQASSLVLTLMNSNQAPLDEVVVQLDGLDPLALGRIAAGTRLALQVAFGARPIAGTELVLAWELRGAALGIAYEQHGEVRLAVRRLQSEDSFDDLFG